MKKIASSFRKTLFLSHQLLIIGALTTLVSCSETEEPADIGLQYFPLSSSSSWTYEVDSISWDPFSNTSDTISFFSRWRTLNVDTISEDLTSIVLVREDSSEEMNSWQKIYTFKMQKDLYRAEISVNGLREVPLVFPVRLNTRWDKMMYQAEGPRFVRFTDLKEEWRYNDLVFTDCIRVSEKNDSNFFQNEQIFDVYAPNVGLVHKFAIETEVQAGGKSGHLFRMQLLNYTP